MANVSKIRNIAVRLIIVLASWGFIIKQVAGRDNLLEAWNLFLDELGTSRFWVFLIIVLMLMIVNWLIEALKWQKLMESVQKVSLPDAVKAILTGVTVSVFTPNRVGEFVGRVFSLRLISPLRAILATLVGSFSQLTVTIVVGSLMSLVFIERYSNLVYNMPEVLYSSVVVLTICVDAGIIMLFLNVSFLTNVIRSLIPRRWRRIKSYVRVFSRFHHRTLLKILSMSFARYVVFTGQYMLLLSLFGLTAPWFDVLMLIVVIWFVMAAIPSFALAELGIRSSVAVSVFSVYYDPTVIDARQTLAIVAGSSLLWIINIALPALLGSLFINRLRIPSPFRSIFK
ncbi:MAG TPA: hypothetical protein DCR43_01735 [Bacteroidales bacterium]|nr:MAG: hypothetical protein A2X11_10510 [Bacteroidetes bacterium GWE2_42_24]OFY28111.1 MAG: hypothetical protein A2X09_00770 [Bacteroidetes bacterium GWF2_43_11]PKP16271.1 MAG: hypothetical protein CVU06_14955 [Bacteroidetes bacterium HGW-Bacteroidetes-22]HAQ64571.1 hypothetical protein [Bacteroidales bacterium]HBZ65491.1 hypothetical protein [Bacteroidales bacterium]